MGICESIEVGRHGAGNDRTDAASRLEVLADGDAAGAVDRRTYRRLDIRLPVECRVLRGDTTHLVRTITRNISTGGLYLELDAPDFAEGDRLDVELVLPPSEGVSPYPGRANCRAEVVRVREIGATTAARFGIAARFLSRLRMSF